MTSLKKHKDYLENLEETDPDFLSFLKENDAELLNFDVSDSDGDDDEDDEDQIHRPPEELEVGSDSEAEEALIDEESEEHKQIVEKTLRKGVVNLHVIADWEQKLTTTKDLTILNNVIEAFESSVESVLKGNVGPEKDGKGKDDGKKKKKKGGGAQKWKVEGSANFNALVRLCIRHIKGFCVRYLCATNNTAIAENMFDTKPYEMKDKYKQRWAKLRTKIKSYMNTLVAFLKSMGNSEAIASVLRHCQKMSGFWALMGNKSFKLAKILINIWSQGEDSCRVLCFLTIIRMTSYNKEIFLERFIKQMYIAYVANSKFTSVTTWPSINFMRSSLVEIYLLDTSVAYSIAFPFIRQLAIHLRNAVTAGTGAGSQTKQTKVEASRIVYSWQFVHSIHLWADLLAQAGSAGDTNLNLLIYPVVQICLGTIKLIPSKKFIPLRFSIVRMLINIQEKTKTFIPILPLITEVLHITDFSAKSVSKFSVRPLDLTCCLKADPTESGYLKAVSENGFECLVGACAAIATELAFPEVICPTLIQLKRFLKKECKNGEVSRKYKTLIDKIEENSNYIRTFRDKALEEGQVSLSNQKSLQILHVQMETAKKQPPLLAFAADFFKVNKRVSAKLRKKNNETKEEKLIPKMSTANKKKGKAKNQASKGPLFADSDDDDIDDEEPFETKLEQQQVNVGDKKSVKLQKKKGKRKISEVNGHDDSDNDDDDDDEQLKVKTKKTKKIKKKKTAKRVKKVFIDTDADVQDEVVDLEFSD